MTMNAAPGSLGPADATGPRAEFDFDQDSHHRWNPLSESWVLCSPHRAKRPWQGAQETPATESKPAYEPKCYLCPGNARTSGQVNPAYTDTFVFPNDFPAVRIQQPDLGHGVSSLLFKDASPRLSAKSQSLFQAQAVKGECKVVCFSPKHNLTMAQMSVNEILPVIQTWVREYDELSAQPHVGNVLIFENKGAAMGCSNPHPHGQIWATSVIPQEPLVELQSMLKYAAQPAGGCLLCDYAQLELAAAAGGRPSRVVAANDSFLAVVPFWAGWPFETLLLPAKRHVSRVGDLTPAERADLAALLRDLAVRYDNLFQCDFPYSMGIHQAPGPTAHRGPPAFPDDLMHLHLHFYPPLLRSASVKKFLVGFEMLGEVQRDLTAEQAAARLRDLNTTHWRDQAPPICK